MSTLVNNLEAPRAAADTWQMPKPPTRSFVHWYDGGIVTREPQLGLVTAIHDSVIEIWIIGHGTYNAMKRPRHVSDPFLAERGLESVQDNDRGTWDFTPEYLAEKEWKSRVEGTIAELQATTLNLRNKVEAVEKRKP